LLLTESLQKNLDLLSPPRSNICRRFPRDRQLHSTTAHHRTRVEAMDLLSSKKQPNPCRGHGRQVQQIHAGTSLSLTESLHKFFELMSPPEEGLRRPIPRYRQLAQTRRCSGAEQALGAPSQAKSSLIHSLGRLRKSQGARCEVCHSRSHFEKNLSLVAAWTEP
jgi:hypothetical protein